MLSSILAGKYLQIIACYMPFKKHCLISERHYFHGKYWHKASRIYHLSTTLCSNFQELPEIIVFLQMMFVVTSGVTVKHLNMYFIKNMYDLITRQEFDFK